MLLTLLLCISLPVGFSICVATQVLVLVPIYIVYSAMNVELSPTLHHLMKLLWWEKSLFKGWVVHSFSFFPIGQSHSLHSTFSCGIFSLLCHLHSFSVGLSPGVFSHFISQEWQPCLTTSLTTVPDTCVLKFIPSLESDILCSLVTPRLLTLLHSRHPGMWLLEFVMMHIGAMTPSLPGLVPFHVIF